MSRRKHEDSDVFTFIASAKWPGAGLLNGLGRDQANLALKILDCLVKNQVPDSICTGKIVVAAPTGDGFIIKVESISEPLKIHIVFENLLDYSLQMSFSRGIVVDFKSGYMDICAFTKSKDDQQYPDVEDDRIPTDPELKKWHGISESISPLSDKMRKAVAKILNAVCSATEFPYPSEPGDYPVVSRSEDAFAGNTFVLCIRFTSGRLSFFPMASDLLKVSKYLCRQTCLLDMNRKMISIELVTKPSGNSVMEPPPSKQSRRGKHETNTE